MRSPFCSRRLTSSGSRSRSTLRKSVSGVSPEPGAGSRRQQKNRRARRVRGEAHLAVLHDREVRRQLAGGEDVRGERVARRGAEVFVLQLRVDRARDALEGRRVRDLEAAEEQRPVGGQRLQRPAVVLGEEPAEPRRIAVLSRLDHERKPLVRSLPDVDVVRARGDRLERHGPFLTRAAASRPAARIRCSPFGCSGTGARAGCRGRP